MPHPLSHKEWGVEIRVYAKIIVNVFSADIARSAHRLTPCPLSIVNGEGEMKSYVPMGL
jgi:hypothetical protein